MKVTLGSSHLILMGQSTNLVSDSNKIAPSYLSMQTIQPLIEYVKKIPPPPLIFHENSLFKTFIQIFASEAWTNSTPHSFIANKSLVQAVVLVFLGNINTSEQTYFWQIQHHFGQCLPLTHFYKLLYIRPTSKSNSNKNPYQILLLTCFIDHLVLCGFKGCVGTCFVHIHVNQIVDICGLLL